MESASDSDEVKECGYCGNKVEDVDYSKGTHVFCSKVCLDMYSNEWR